MRHCLYHAAFYGDTRELKQAMEGGQDPVERDPNGSTAFHIAAANGHIPFLEALLEQGIDVNGVDNNGCTALHLAARNGHLAAIQWLVARGGDVKRQTKKGRSVLDVARYQAERERQRSVIDYLKTCEREKMSWEMD